MAGGSDSGRAEKQRQPFLFEPTVWLPRARNQGSLPSHMTLPIADAERPPDTNGWTDHRRLADQRTLSTASESYHQADTTRRNSIA